MATQHITLKIDGMTCQACASRIEKVLNKKDFIHSASVNFAGETAQIEFDNEQMQVADLITIIEKTGFQATLPSVDGETVAEVSHWRVWVLLLLALPFMVGMLGMLVGTHAWMPPVWVQVLIATVVQVYFAVPFYRGAIASVRGGLANMDVLVSMGTLAIYLYSLGMVWAGHGAHHVYFEAGVMVLAFVSLGKFLEERTKRGSLNALGALLQLTPREVLCYQNEIWQTVPLNRVQKGDVLRCVQGGRIGADGTVIAGEAWADESHLTGESQPVYKTVGSSVLAGSLIAGSVDYRVNGLGKETLLGDMMTALAEAQGSKAPIARLADKVAGVFVPVVLAIAVFTFGLTAWLTGNASQGLVNAVAVLVVACPCALGLATPASVMAGMGLAVQHGVWFKNASVLEQAGAVDTIVLDKTGTLTQGKPDLVAMWTTAEFSEAQLLTFASAVERHTTHPLAHAIVQTAEQRQLPHLTVNNIHTHAGEGISATLAELGEIKIGKASFCGVDLPEYLAQNNPVWRIASHVAVSLNGKPVGAFALADTLKADSLSALHRLREQGMEIYLLSGDHPATVAHIAQALHIPNDHAHGNQSPRQKAQFIEQLKQQNRTVAMVGDGINDAPALALADIGLAIRGSTDIAEHSADAVLVQASVQSLADGMAIARATLRTIKQNLFFAFIYNIIGIPLASFGLLTPALAGAMMALSSLSVLGNALRLKKMKV